jgi:hypothetical protein
MGSKGVAAIAFLVALLLVDAKVVDAMAANARVEYSASQYLKNFALSACIAQAYKSDEVVKDSRAAADGYLQLGSFPYEAHEEAAALARKFLAKDYQSYSGAKLVLMKCIDLFNSKELDRLAKKYLRK